MGGVQGADRGADTIGGPIGEPRADRGRGPILDTISNLSNTISHYLTIFNNYFTLFYIILCYLTLFKTILTLFYTISYFRFQLLIKIGSWDSTPNECILRVSGLTGQVLLGQLDPEITIHGTFACQIPPPTGGSHTPRRDETGPSGPKKT